MVTTVLTTFLVFLPMFFMTGMIGKFVYVIPLVVSLALFVSILESVFALPAHIRRGLEKRAGAKRAASRAWFKRIRSFYRKLCYHLLKFRYPPGGTVYSGAGRYPLVCDK